MLYVDYEVFKANYINAQHALDMVLQEKTLIFQRTQPKSASSDGEKVGGSHESNKFEDYVIALEEKEIDIRIDALKGLLRDRKDLLKLKEDDLRRSKAQDDMVYCMRYLDGLKVREIATKTYFSESYIYKILKIIRKNVKCIKNDR